MQNDSVFGAYGAWLDRHAADRRSRETEDDVPTGAETREPLRGGDDAHC